MQANGNIAKESDGEHGAGALNKLLPNNQLYITILVNHVILRSGLRPQEKGGSIFDKMNDALSDNIKIEKKGFVMEEKEYTAEIVYGKKEVKECLCNFLALKRENCEKKNEKKIEITTPME